MGRANGEDELRTSNKKTAKKCHTSQIQKQY